MRPIIWGVFLIVIGGLLLLERFGGLHAPAGTFWPLVLFALAASAFARRRIASGVLLTLIATLFLACALGLYGLSYHNSWPLFIVAVGVGIVLRAFIPDGPRRPRGGEVNHG